MPFSDWQFWVVTAVGVIALIAAARVLIPPRKRGKRTPLTVSAPGKQR